jgi:hypothetical protein
VWAKINQKRLLLLPPCRKRLFLGMAPRRGSESRSVKGRGESQRPSKTNYQKKTDIPQKACLHASILLDNAWQKKNEMFSHETGPKLDLATRGCGVLSGPIVSANRISTVRNGLTNTQAQQQLGMETTMHVCDMKNKTYKVKVGGQSEEKREIDKIYDDGQWMNYKTSTRTKLKTNNNEKKQKTTTTTTRDMQKKKKRAEQHLHLHACMRV